MLPSMCTLMQKGFNPDPSGSRVGDHLARTHLKNVFWPNIFVGASFKILNIQQYASGFKLGPAAILNQNPIFEMGSKRPAVV